MHRHFEKDNIAKCASTVVRNTIQWEENFTISPANEKDLHNLFGHCSSVSTFYSAVWEGDFRSTTRILSFTGSNELYFSCVRNQWQAVRSRARLSPLDANKSRNSDAPNTRGFRVCRWNLISAAFVTKHAAVLFSPFSTRSPAPPPSLFILCARFSMRSRYRPRDTIFA